MNKPKYCVVTEPKGSRGKKEKNVSIQKIEK